MPSLLARIRQWFGVPTEPTDEQLRLLEELAEQKARVRSLDVYLAARTSHDRRQSLSQTHPKRRATDRG